jgi:hypothetical protein
VYTQHNKQNDEETQTDNHCNARKEEIDVVFMYQECVHAAQQNDSTKDERSAATLARRR